MYKDSLSFLFDTIFCLAAFYSLYWFLLRKEKSFLFNRILLLSAVIFSFVIPFVSITSLFNNPLCELSEGILNMINGFVIEKFVNKL